MAIALLALVLIGFSADTAMHIKADHAAAASNSSVQLSPEKNKTDPAAQSQTDALAKIEAPPQNIK